MTKHKLRKISELKKSACTLQYDTFHLLGNDNEKYFAKTIVFGVIVLDLFAKRRDYKDK